MQLYQIYLEQEQKLFLPLFIYVLSTVVSIKAAPFLPFWGNTSVSRLQVWSCVDRWQYSFNELILKSNGKKHLKM